MVAGLSRDRLAAVGQNFRTASQTDPASTELAFRQLAIDLVALGEHAQALDLASSLFGIEWLPDIERRILYDWIDSDPDSLRSSLLARAESGGNDEHHLSILASLILTEHSGNIADWSQWITNLTESKHETLRGQLVAKTMIHSAPSHLDTVSDLVEQSAHNSYAMSHLPQFVAQTLFGEPDKALSWISSLENADGRLKAEALASVISDVALGDPARAEQLLASEDTGTDLPNYQSPLHEQMVESYVRRMVLINPELASRGLVHLRNETLRRSLAANIASRSPHSQNPQPTNQQ